MPEPHGRKPVWSWADVDWDAPPLQPHEWKPVPISDEQYRRAKQFSAKVRAERRRRAAEQSQGDED